MAVLTDRELLALQREVQRSVTPLRQMHSLSASATLSSVQRIVRVDASAGAVTITLCPSQELLGETVTIVKTENSANGVTISPNGTDTISGGSSWALPPSYRSTVVLRATAGGWDLISYTLDQYGAGNAEIPDGSVTTPKLADGAVTLAKFASTIEPVSIVAALPDPATGPKIVYLTTDGKLYRKNAAGTAYEAGVNAVDITGTIVNAQIAVDAIQGDVIAAGAITAAKLADGSVSGTKFASGIEPVAVLAALPSPVTASSPSVVFLTTDRKLYRKNAANTAYVVSVPTTDLSGTIATSQIALAAITEDLLAAAAVTETKIADGSISTPKLVAGAVTTAKLAAGAVTANEIAAGAVTTAKLAAAAVTANEIAAGAITTAKLAAGAVTANEIAADTITAGQIAAGAISATELATDAVTAIKIAADAVTAAKIAAGAITSAKIAAGQIIATHLAAGIIAASHIASGAIETHHLTAGLVTANEIAANAVTFGKIAAGAVRANEIAADEISTTHLAATTIQDPGGTRGILFKGTRPVAWARYLDLTATGTASFLKHEALDLKADGSAIFSGALQAATGSFAGDISAATGTFGGGLSGSGVVGTTQLAGGAVTDVKLGTGAVTEGKLGTGAVTEGKIGPSAVTNGKIATDAITRDKILNGEVVGVKIADGAVTATKIDVVNLSAIKADLGVVTAGLMQDADATPTAGILLSGTLPGTWTKYINFVAAGSQAFLQHPALTLTADGNATFSGALSAATGTFAGNLSAAGGTFAGELSAATGTFAGDISAASGTFSGTIASNSFTTSEAIFNGMAQFTDRVRISHGIPAIGYEPGLELYGPTAGGGVERKGRLFATGTGSTVRFLMGTGSGTLDIAGALTINGSPVDSSTSDVNWSRIIGEPEYTTRWPAFSEVTGTAAATQIPDLDASKIATGTFLATQIPTLPWSKLDSGTFPTTLAAHGITNAYTKTEADALLGGKSDTTHTHSLTSGQITDNLPWSRIEPTTLPALAYLDAASNVFTSDVMSAQGAIWRERVTGTSLRTYRHLAQYSASTSAVTGAIVIKTNMVAESVNVMGQIRLRGFNYVTGANVLDATVSGYFYAGGASPAYFHHSTLTQTGDWRPQIRVMISSDGYWCIVLGDVGTEHAYPKVWVEEVMLGHSASDTLADGWTTALVTDLTSYLSPTGVSPVDRTKVPWSGVQSTPTTLSGYGITDAYTQNATDALLTDRVRSVPAALGSQLLREQALYGIDGGSNPSYGRGINRAPNTYQASLQYEFKEVAGIGMGGGQTYAGLLTLAGYTDASSGQTHAQIGHSAATLQYRYAAFGAGPWSAWSTFAFLERAQTWSAAQTWQGAQHITSTLKVGTNAVVSEAGDVGASRNGAPTTGVYYFGNSLTKYLYYDGADFRLNGGSLIVGGALTLSGALSGTSATLSGNAGVGGYLDMGGHVYIAPGNFLVLDGGASIQEYLYRSADGVVRVVTNGVAAADFNNTSSAIYAALSVGGALSGTSATFSESVQAAGGGTDAAYGTVMQLAAAGYPTTYRHLIQTSHSALSSGNKLRFLLNVDGSANLAIGLEMTPSSVNIPIATILSSSLSVAGAFTGSTGDFSGTLQADSYTDGLNNPMAAVIISTSTPSGTARTGTLWARVS